MDDAERIRTLRDEGRISDAQAARLLAALDELGAAAEGPEGSQDGRRDEPRASAEMASGPSDPAHAPASSTGAAPHVTPGASAGTPGTAAGPGTTPSPQGAADAVVTRWARVGMFAGSLRVRVDPELREPAVECDGGEVDLTAAADGWRIDQRARSEGSWIERLVEGVRRVRLELRLPADTGLHLDAKAGEVRLEGVPALRGRLLAGDLDARGLRAIDFAVQAGDVDVGLEPAPGEHRLRVTAGDAKVHLPAHADVRIEGRVTVGDASAPAPFEAHRSGVAERVDGVMGEGRAHLLVTLTTGDFGVKVGA